MEQFLLVPIFLAILSFFYAIPALSNDDSLVISKSFVVSKCWGQTRTKQTCKVTGQLGQANDAISIYDGTKWVAAGVIVSRKGSNTTILVEERFETVRPGFLIVNNSGENADLDVKFMFSKPDSY
ncbi:MAG: hypothetical protein HRU09_09290 [Oligoflexales bacterium]|nr:hypothetical protein [Oligoflexales bacterium]